ncbi:STY0301 family protein [Massilia sp. CCM 9210]|uniref:STY0301 family protein n=1 Tax=Massilia scottii TaxID=3057166 RepID=UPI002796C91A|nr:STY0301 family protein [Massilia sp. CCM 9210]MDQ1814178.1 STY0301 family protein [Massilia sp. CCM 9210]
MKNISFIMINVLFFCRIGLAQTCPANITTSPELSALLPDWIILSKTQTHDLTGLDIITGQLGPNSSGFEQTLLPMNKDDVAFWKLSDMENGKVWMRCHYRNTSLKIAKRLNTNIVECFQRNERNAPDPKKQKIIAMCVDSTHKNTY